MPATPRPAAVALGAGAVVAALAAPAAAQAHGIGGRTDLPIPRVLFVYAASAVLVLSFVALAALWPRPRLQEPEAGRRVLRLPAAVLDPLLGALGVAAFAGLVYAGYAGSQAATANVVPTAVFVVFWVGLPLASLLAGDVFAAVNPWRAVGRAAGGLVRRIGGDAVPEPIAYPARLGRWPAAVGILAFAWLELVDPSRDEPSVLATLMLVYAGVMLLGMSLFGVRAWTEQADPFAVYFALFARLSPARWERGALFLRPPLAGAPSLDAGPGTVALLCVMIGTTSFDGLSQGPLWTDVVGDLQDAVVGLGFGQQTALEIASTAGLLAVVALVSGLYRAGVAGMRSVGGTAQPADLGARFAHTLIPIALAYVVAHYFSLLAYQGQAVGYLASDPLGTGTDYLGTAGASIDYGVITASGIWYVQVAALVLGHAAGLVLAHDRALALFPRPRDATRSQWWMLAVMVAFTCLGLWLLSAQAG